jgi:transcriptional regulator with XRE-family HTH domain
VPSEAHYWKAVGLPAPAGLRERSRPCPTCAERRRLTDPIDGNHPVWNHPEMRRALALRDIGTVFRLLQRHGLSQRRIAALTGQSQSEVSEILNGRQVVSYDVLLRICTGLAIQRGRLGLAYDPETAALIGEPTTTAYRAGGDGEPPPLWEIFEQIERDAESGPDGRPS